MSGTIRTAACLIERGERIELEDGSTGTVQKRYNSSAGRTFLYLMDGRRLAVTPLHMLTIAGDDDQPVSSTENDVLHGILQSAREIAPSNYSRKQLRPFLALAFRAGAAWERTHPSTDPSSATPQKETR